MNPVLVKAEPVAWDWNDYSMEVNVPAYGMIAFEFRYKTPEKKKKADDPKKADASEKADVQTKVDAPQKADVPKKAGRNKKVRS